MITPPDPLLVGAKYKITPDAATSTPVNSKERVMNILSQIVLLDISHLSYQKARPN